MIEVGKYYKVKEGDIVVKALSGIANGAFIGKIVLALDSQSIGVARVWDFIYFEPCEAPETPLPEATPTKDVELRLECLKLAIQANCVDSVIAAKEYYEWITKTTNQ
jgi:hypothetical protein